MGDDRATIGTRPRIVILGAGFAGAYCAQALERTLRGVDAEVVLIDRHNYFVFHPLLIEAGTGSLEPRHAVVPIRAFLRRADFLMAEIRTVDVEARTVAYQLVGDEREQTIAADHLVIALGSVTRLPGAAAVPGLHEHGFEMKNLADAVALRDRAIEMLELANATADASMRRRLLHVVVVGGNFAGVEVAGEFDVLLRQASRRYPHVMRGECGVTLIELADRILGALDEELSAYAADHLRRRGVSVRLGTTVAEVGKDHVRLSSGERIEARTVIWCAGIEPTPLVRRLAVPLDERGYILCERDLRVRGFRNVWAIGDCAVNTDAAGSAYPATAQHAVREGAHLAKSIALVLRGRAARPCDIVSKGSIAPLGCRTGVARVFGIKLSGFAAWFLWRTVYLLKMPTLARKVRVALDWTIDLVFSRDYVQLGVHRPPLRAEGTMSAAARPGPADRPRHPAALG
jgi:NADH dehydrogenase